MKICILTPRFPFPENGGDVLRINGIARYLKSKGHELILVSLCEDSIANYADAEELYDKVISVHHSKLKGCFGALLSFLFRSHPLQCGYYWSSKYKRILRQVIKEEQPEQKEVVKEVGRPKQDVTLYKPLAEIDEAVRAYATPKMREAIQTQDKLERLENMDAVEVETKEHFAEIYPEGAKDIDSVLYSITKETVRNMILDEGIRPDNRKHEEIRPIWCETAILPRTHGTGLFKRGQTQVLSVCTLAPASEAQTIDGITEQTSKRYMHHYNFPGFSVGEAKTSRSPGRREIGHGALGERALSQVIPSVETFPYTIRVVSEVFESNGSSSQASICAATMALMAAGVPIKAPVAGIAMGLITNGPLEEGHPYTVLTDIQGMEDHLGDMDFKVAGTRDGVCALQSARSIDIVLDSKSDFQYRADVISEQSQGA